MMREGAGRKTSYCPELHETIIANIKRGCFLHVAAEAAGITFRTFRRWIVDAETRGEESPYYQLYLDVQQAKAETRMLAESRVYKENPLAWLRLGPGRTTDEKEGWTDKEGETTKAKSDNTIVVFEEVAKTKGAQGA